MSSALGDFPREAEVDLIAVASPVHAAPDGVSATCRSGPRVRRMSPPRADNRGRRGEARVRRVALHGGMSRTGHWQSRDAQATGGRGERERERERETRRRGVGGIVAADLARRAVVYVVDCGRCNTVRRTLATFLSVMLVLTVLNGSGDDGLSPDRTVCLLLN